MATVLAHQPPGTGVKVPLRDPEQFIGEYARELVALIGDVGRRAELGGRARDRMITHHDWRQIQAELVDAYASVLPAIRNEHPDHQPCLAATTA